MVLDLFKKLENLPDKKLHPKFLLLRDEITLDGEKNIIIDWTNGFQDRDNKIIKEFQTTFHSAFWEFYLFSVFRETKLSIDFSRNRPDFIIKNPYEINVEAVVSEIKQNGRSENERTLNDILGMLTTNYMWSDFQNFTNEAITRYSNSILSKHKKFTNEYSHCSWLKNDTPFVIALSSYAQVNYGKEFFYPMLALLYGYFFNPETNDYKQVNNIIKPGTTAQIPVGLFKNSAMEDVSAIIFSSTLTLGKLSALSKSKNNLNMNHVFTVRHDNDPPHFKLQEVSSSSPEELTDGLFVFHNPFAKNKLPQDVFASTNATQIVLQDKELSFKGENLPIVSRLNISKLLLPEQQKKQFLCEMFEQLNPDIKIPIFKVLEIDLLMIPKEITLLDQITEFPIIVELSDEDVVLIKKSNITEGDIVGATLKNSIYELGTTENWSLISIEKQTYEPEIT